MCFKGNMKPRIETYKSLIKVEAPSSKFCIFIMFAIFLKADDFIFIICTLTVEHSMQPGCATYHALAVALGLIVGPLTDKVDWGRCGGWSDCILWDMRALTGSPETLELWFQLWLQPNMLQLQLRGRR